MIVTDLLSFIDQIPSITLEAICSKPDHKDKLHAFQKKHQIKNVYTDFEDLLCDEQVDTVYIGLPNHLHFAYAKKALLHGKHVICEKPFTSSLAQFLELKELSQRKELVLAEAITNQHAKTYLALKEYLDQLGDIKIVACNYSQFSSRYAKFKEGDIHPVFNPAMAGGALMDINLYNIHFTVGLFGLPDEVHYRPNVENGVDTSGILLMEYPGFTGVCIGAKDSTGSNHVNIQGNAGFIHIEGSTNDITSFTCAKNNGESVQVEQSGHMHRMYEEFVEFERIITQSDLPKAKRMLNHSENVMRVVEMARQSANLTPV